MSLWIKFQPQLTVIKQQFVKKEVSIILDCIYWKFTLGGRETLVARLQEENSSLDFAKLNIVLTNKSDFDLKPMDQTAPLGSLKQHQTNIRTFTCRRSIKASWSVSPWNPGTGSELANTKKSKIPHIIIQCHADSHLLFLFVLALTGRNSSEMST